METMMLMIDEINNQYADGLITNAEAMSKIILIVHEKIHSTARLYEKELQHTTDSETIDYLQDSLRILGY